MSLQPTANPDHALSPRGTVTPLENSSTQTVQQSQSSLSQAPQPQPNTSNTQEPEADCLAAAWDQVVGFFRDFVEMCELLCSDVVLDQVKEIIEDTFHSVLVFFGLAAEEPVLSEVVGDQAVGFEEEEEEVLLVSPMPLDAALSLAAAGEAPVGIEPPPPLQEDRHPLSPIPEEPRSPPVAPLTPTKTPVRPTQAELPAPSDSLFGTLTPFPQITAQPLHVHPSPLRPQMPPTLVIPPHVEATPVPSPQITPATTPLAASLTASLAARLASQLTTPVRPSAPSMAAQAKATPPNKTPARTPSASKTPSSVRRTYFGTPTHAHMIKFCKDGPLPYTKTIKLANGQDLPVWKFSYELPEKAQKAGAPESESPAATYADLVEALYKNHRAGVNMAGIRLLAMKTKLEVRVEHCSPLILMERLCNGNISFTESNGTQHFKDAPEVDGLISRLILEATDRVRDGLLGSLVKNLEYCYQMNELHLKEFADKIDKDSFEELQRIVSQHPQVKPVYTRYEKRGEVSAELADYKHQGYWYRFISVVLAKKIKDPEIRAQVFAKMEELSLAHLVTVSLEAHKANKLDLKKFANALGIQPSSIPKDFAKWLNAQVKDPQCKALYVEKMGDLIAASNMNWQPPKK